MLLKEYPIKKFLRLPLQISKIIFVKELSKQPYSPCATFSNTTVIKLVMFYASMIYGIHRHVHILSHETASSNIGPTN